MFFTNLQFLDILIDYQGQLKLSDFGAAKILAKGQKTMGRTTMNMHVNSLAGTPMYMVKYLLHEDMFRFIKLYIVMLGPRSHYWK
jgi:serine/threonine protein kinase